MPAVEEQLLDVRRFERALAEGQLTPAQLQAHIDALPDCAADAEESSVRMIAYFRSHGDADPAEAGREEDEG